MKFSINDRGIDALLRELAKLPEGLAVRVQGDGLYAAARVARDKARELVPVGPRAKRPGERRLGKTIRRARRSQFVYLHTGGGKKIRAAAAQLIVGGRGARHGALVEYGTRPRSGVSRRGRRYSHPGSRAINFTETAVESTIGAQVSAMVPGMEASIQKLGREIYSGVLSSSTSRLIDL